MHKTAFLAQAERNTIDLFHAYCHDNDMEKVLSYFSKESCFISWGKDEIYLDFEAITATLHRRKTLPYFIELSNVHTEIIDASASFCVVLYSANALYHIDEDTAANEFLRASAVFRLEDNEPKISFLHCSAAKGIHDLGKILPLEHGVEATKFLTKLECDRSMAIDICEHTPNGLIYCQIGEHYPLIYANQSFCEIMGCDDFTDLMQYTEGRIERAVYREGLPRVQQARLSHISTTPYTITYRLVTKQGTLKWVMERGRYISDQETGEEYFICTIIPLELNNPELSYGNLVDFNYINNAKISVELFLQQTLDFMDFNNRALSCQKLLQQCCETLQASGGIVCSIKDKAMKMEPLYYYDANNHPMGKILCNYTWEEMEGVFSEDGFSICSDLNAIPDDVFQEQNTGYIKSAISKVITIDGHAAYLLTFFHRHKLHSWTESEQDIILQTSKLYSILLDESF